MIRFVEINGGDLAINTRERRSDRRGSRRSKIECRYAIIILRIRGRIERERRRERSSTLHTLPVFQEKLRTLRTLLKRNKTN